MIKFHYLTWFESDTINRYDAIYNGNSITPKTAQECRNVVISDKGIVEDIGLSIDCLDCIDYFGLFKLKNYIHDGDGIYEIHCEIDQFGFDYPLVIEVKKVG